MTSPEPPPLYEGPGAQAAREAALSAYTQYEPVLYAAYLDMMTTWLDQVRQAVITTGVTTLALMPDPYSVFTQQPAWNDLVATYTETVVHDVLSGVYHQILPGGGAEFSNRPFVHNFIADSTNKLKGMPDEVFAVIQQIIDKAVVNGASIPDIAAQIEQALSIAGSDTWKNRAATVARTEIHAAYSGGTYDAFRMIVEADPDTPWVLRWLATEDERTRPTHRAADGQTVPFGTQFQVGDAHLWFPGDPTGPPQEIINCRCTMLLEEENHPTNMTNRGYTMTAAGETLGEYALQFGFNPFEKRDKRGRWTLGGAVDKLVNDTSHAHHADITRRSREARADKPFEMGGGRGGEAILSGYGKKFDGKTPSQIAHEYDKGKHTYPELPEPAKTYIAKHSDEIRNTPLPKPTLGEHKQAQRKAQDIAESATEKVKLTPAERRRRARALDSDAGIAGR